MLNLGLRGGSLFEQELINKGIMANIKTKGGLVIEGMLHAGKSIKWRNSLPSLSSRLKHKSQDADMNAALSVQFSLLHFMGNFFFFFLNREI